MIGKASPTVAREALLARRRRQRLESQQSLKSANTNSSREEEDSSYGTTSFNTGPSPSIESNEDTFSHQSSDTGSYKNLQNHMSTSETASTLGVSTNRISNHHVQNGSSIQSIRRGGDYVTASLVNNEEGHITTTASTPKTKPKKMDMFSSHISSSHGNLQQQHRHQQNSIIDSNLASPIRKHDNKNEFLSEDDEETFSNSLDRDPDMSFEDSSQDNFDANEQGRHRYRSTNHQQAFRVKKEVQSDEHENENSLSLYSSRPPYYHLTPDSSCIPYHSMIMISTTDGHSKASMRYLAAVDPSSTTIDPSSSTTTTTNSTSSTSILTAQMTGRGLSQPYECFILQPVVSSSTSLLQQDEPLQPETNIITKGKGLIIDTNTTTTNTQTHTQQYVQCGDIISIHSPTNHNRALGVRRKKYVPHRHVGIVDDPATTTTEEDLVAEEEFDVGFFHRLFGPVSDAEQWMVLSGVLPGRVISVQQNLTRNSSMPSHPIDKTLVRVGQPLVLQNILTGGILSCTPITNNIHTTTKSYEIKETKLRILTTMYQRKKYEHEVSSMELDKSHMACSSTTIGKDLLHFLTEHIRIPITSQETFTIIPVNIPPIPSWATSTNFLHERVYLNGFFLRFPQRLDTPLEMEEVLFRSKDFMMKRALKEGGHRVYTTATTIHFQNLNLLAQQSVDIQEKVLMDDILGALLGLEGNVLRAYPLDLERIEPKSYCHVSFRIVSETITGGRLDASLINLVSRLLPACDAFVNVHAFVSSSSTRYEMGKIAQALCCAMDSFLQDYLESVIFMEDRFRNSSISSPIKLSELYADNQRMLETITILDHVVSRVKEDKGGSLLNILFEMMLEYSGNDLAKSIFSHLLDIASKPYFLMLSQWLESGYLQDPYGEFMIQQSHLGSLDKQNFVLYDDDWAKWYSLRTEHVFQTLISYGDKGFDTDTTIQKILLTGKYWNAVSLCKDRSDVDVRYVTRKIRSNLYVSQLPVLTYQTFPVDVCTFVNHCFEEASQTLYNVMIRDYQLIEVLRFTKNYFLLDQGDFFIHFMDMAEDELLQEMAAVSKGRVGAWAKYSLQLGRNFPGIPSQENGSHCKALRNIAASLQCDFALDSLIEALDHLHAASGGIQSDEPKTPSRHLYGGAEKGLTGIEAFMLTYGKRYFPLSLFLSTRTVSNYQLLFRHIFFSKHVERRLVGTWLDHQMIKEYHQSLRKELGPTYCLRHRMLHFVQNFVYYVMFEVIEPNWTRMASQIRPTTDDGIGASHRSILTVDDILRIHNDFVITSLKECLLTNRNLVRTFTKLLTTCLLFSDQMKLFMETTDIVSDASIISIE